MRAEEEAGGGGGKRLGMVLTLSTVNITRVTQDIAGPHPPRKSTPFVRKRRKRWETNGSVKSPLEIIET